MHTGFAHQQIMDSVEKSFGDITHYLHGLSTVELLHIQDHINNLSEYLQHELNEAKGLEQVTVQTTTVPARELVTVQTTANAAGRGGYGQNFYDRGGYGRGGYGRGDYDRDGHVVCKRVSYDQRRRSPRSYDPRY